MRYDFECRACQHVFEEDVKLLEYEADPNIVCCPECGVCNPERLITNPSHYKHSSYSRWRMGHGS